MSTIEAMAAAAKESTATRRVMRVMDPKAGDLKVAWDPENTDETDHARKTFDDMRAKGFVAYAVDRKGKKSEVVSAFDPEAEALILTPPVRGG